ncbi:DUF742 domain-containing protein [Salininema proteolyticum]|uniref:DUF742 domain-containing protein n=1 Tax=Salininema proteolyticum TaxID=1607685 RepID=A0ABV8TUJ5_9ACTN
MLLDNDAGRLTRPYTVSRGRTAASAKLDLLSLVKSTGQLRPSQLEAEHAETLLLCRTPVSVAEIAAHLRLPSMVIKVLLSDLVECGAVTAHAPDPAVKPSDHNVLEALLNGLQRRL